MDGTRLALVFLHKTWLFFLIRKLDMYTVLKYGINPQMKCSGKNDIISNLGFPRLVKNHQTVLKLADILNRKWQMFNFLCTSR